MWKKRAKSSHFCLCEPLTPEPGPPPDLVDMRLTLALTRDLPFDVGQLSWARVADSDGRRGHALTIVHIKQIP